MTDIVMRIINDIREEMRIYSKDNFATKWMHNNKENYVTYFRNLLCVPVAVSDTNHGIATELHMKCGKEGDQCAKHIESVRPQSSI